MEPDIFYSKRIFHHKFLRDAVESLDDEDIKTADIVITGKIYITTEIFYSKHTQIFTYKMFYTHKYSHTS